MRIIQPNWPVTNDNHGIGGTKSAKIPPTESDVSTLGRSLPGYDNDPSAVGFPCPHSVLSWLFDARKAPRKSRSQSVPCRHEAVRRHASGSSSPPTVDGSNWTPEPSPQSQSFSGLRIHFADFLAYIVPSTEAVHLET
ncbi:hypothetical protein Bca52824_095261 [Brassica carinata]|uniref:Uncharacterized protein n=1 Tax=Brassica carinata TaxID=52824 RepID=A0A8X7TID2_BRACI|nr:hypothetical protein Bca52824_095261 [Brassica carinata]